MKDTEKLIFPSDAFGRLAGFLFLALIPLTVLVPVKSAHYWLTQDLTLRLTVVLVFSLCLSSIFFQRLRDYSLKLDFTDLVALSLAGWVLLSVKNSKEAFESFYAFRSFLAMLFWWFSILLLWRRWPGLYPVFEKVLFYTALLAAAWLLLSTLGHGVSPYLHNKLIPRIGFFPNENIAAGFLGLVLIWGVLKRLHQGWVPLWGLVLFFVAWCVTQSRGAFLSMSLVVVVYCLLHMREIEQRLAQWTRNQWLAAGGAVLVLA